jgi:hypothetical protein
MVFSPGWTAMVGSMRLIASLFEAVIAATGKRMPMGASKIAMDVMAARAAKTVIGLKRINSLL